MVLAIAALLFQLSPAAGPEPVAPADSGQPTLAKGLPDAPNLTKPAGQALTPNGVQARFAKPDRGDLQASVPTSFASNAEASVLPRAIGLSRPDSGKAGLIARPERLPSRREWIALALAQHAAAAFDAYSTRAAIARGAVENDPLMRPFANSSAIYVAIQAAPVVLDFTARHMQRSQNAWLRRGWWMPQSLASGVFLFSGAHNLRVAGRLN